MRVPRYDLRARLRSRAALRGWIDTPKRMQKHIGNALFDRERGVIMDWSARAGGTVAVKMFFRHMGLLDTALAHSAWVHDYRRQRFYEEHPVTSTDLLNRRHVLFKVVRNPYTRAVSSLGQKVRQRKGTDRIIQALGLTDIEDITFRQFAQYLGTTDLLSRSDSHYRLQARDYERLKLRKPIICRIEHLEQDIDAVNRRYRFHFDPTGLTSAHHAARDETLTSFFGDTPWRDLPEPHPPYRCFYDRELFESVKRTYRDDLDAYRYRFPWPDCL